jgi:hypothetical protein
MEIRRQITNSDELNIQSSESREEKFGDGGNPMKKLQ